MHIYVAIISMIVTYTVVVVATTNCYNWSVVVVLTAVIVVPLALVAVL